MLVEKMCAQREIEDIEILDMRYVKSEAYLISYHLPRLITGV